MNRREYTRCATYFLLGVGLLAMATLYAQAAVWPLAVAFGVGAVVSADAGLYVQETARERCLWGAPVVTEQPCGASVPGLSGTPAGPCVLPQRHDGPFHKATDGTTWWTTRAETGEEPLLNGDGRPVCICTTEQQCLTCQLKDDAAPACLFCHRDNPENKIFAENAHCYARWDNHPAAPGHVEIVTRRHIESFFDLTKAELLAVHRFLSIARDRIEFEYQPDGYTIGVNEGAAAGRTIDHLHIHLIPRRHGDVPDPRGGVRHVLPGTDPDRWATR